MRYASPNASARPPAPYNGRASNGRAMTRLFGTDGIRGVANEEPLTPDLAFRVGRQLVATLQLDHRIDRVRLVIGRDTRLSGPLLESALVAGLLSARGQCYALGVLPTPADALLTKKLRGQRGH